MRHLRDQIGRFAPARLLALAAPLPSAETPVTSTAASAAGPLVKLVGKAKILTPQLQYGMGKASGRHPMPVNLQRALLDEMVQQFSANTGRSAKGEHENVQLDHFQER